MSNIDSKITQNILSGAIEASPDLTDWLPDMDGKELSSEYFYLFKKKTSWLVLTQKQSIHYENFSK